MDTRWRQGMVYAAGIATGVVLASLVGMMPKAKPEAPKVAIVPAKDVQVASVRAPSPACAFDAIVSATRADDGKLVPAEAGPAKTRADVSAAIVQGKEAVAAGRDRDAEVAFLSACRIAAQVMPEGSQELADAKYQLARHYGALARERAPKRAELLKRAQPLYEDSLRVYLARYGDTHEKTRFAAEGLASVRQESAQAATRRTRAPTPAAVPRAPQVPAQASGSAYAQQVAKVPQPSFDCEKAGSVAERLICSDAELARLDRDLGSLYARAKRGASDLEAFQRFSDREWRRRESECGDRDCLQRWYAQRRHQLQEQVDEQLAESR